MNLNITEHVRRIAVVSLCQQIDAFNAPELRAQLHKQFEQGVHRFVLDLSTVPFLDSAGMAVLVSLLKRTHEVDGDVVLVWPQEEAARRILHLTKFHRVFRMAETADAALALL